MSTELELCNFHLYTTNINQGIFARHSHHLQRPFLLSHLLLLSKNIGLHRCPTLCKSFTVARKDRLPTVGGVSCSMSPSAGNTIFYKDLQIAL